MKPNMNERDSLFKHKYILKIYKGMEAKSDKNLKKIGENWFDKGEILQIIK